MYLHTCLFVFIYLFMQNRSILSTGVTDYCIDLQPTIVFVHWLVLLPDSGLFFVSLSFRLVCFVFIISNTAALTLL